MQRWRRSALGMFAGLILAAPAHAADTAGAGSTFVYPILSKWAADYRAKTGNNVNYQSIGSARGIEEIKAASVAFGASDMSLNPDYLAKLGMGQFPLVIGGVVPVVNLEWIQKIHRDAAERGYTAEATVNTILRRMPDYVNYITPQFSLTDINFQRVATVDTSNPFIARDIPTPDESFVVIRFRKPKGVDFPYLLNMIHGSFMSRSNTIVVPGGKMSLAMELILTPLMHYLIEKRRMGDL